MFYEKIDAAGFSLYEMCLLFLIWSFIGWAIEVCAHALKMGEYSNRGFLSMPLCPIYGCGVLIITIILKPFMDIPIVMFLFSSLICTAFELFVGVMMKLIFHNIWWDYSDEHFNFKGYICLKVSLLWGFGCLIVEYCAEPSIEWFIGIIPEFLGTMIIAVMAVLMMIDCINSVAAVNKMNLRLKEISEISAKMYGEAQILGKTLADTALSAADKGSEAAAKIYIKKMESDEKADIIRENITEKTEETMEKLRSRYDALVAFSDKSTVRLIKAYPKLRSVNYKDALDKIREKINSKNED